MQPVVRKGECGAVFAVAQVEDGIRPRIVCAPRDPRPVLPVAHLLHAAQRGPAEAFPARLEPADEQRHDARLHPARSDQMAVVRMGRPAQLGQAGVPVRLGFHLLGRLCEPRQGGRGPRPFEGF
jgi:hypothetical protein